jgi:hypothetical protein
MKQLVDPVQLLAASSCMLFSAILKVCMSYVMLFFCVQAACILHHVVCSLECCCAHGDAMALCFL